MAKEKKWKDVIFAYALKNAIEHEGKAEEAKVISSLFHEGLEKEQVKSVISDVKEIVKKVNSLDLEEQKKEFKDFEKITGKREERKGLPELPNVSKKMVFRIAPEPSKYNHIGHAFTFLINYLYSRKYRGKCKLRFEDANPELVSKEYVDAMKEDMKYLGIRVANVRFVSADMLKLYKYAEQLIRMKKAFMCFCTQEKIKKLREQGVECSCRQHEVKKNLSEWKKFLKGKYMKGEATLRLKGDMFSNNYVMRDPVIFRAIKARHYKYKDKYKIWPMYDFYNPIEDSFMGVTHILRSNEFEVRVDLHNYIRDLLKLERQTIMQYGRINVIGATTKGREIRELVANKKYIGWDDPRLVTLRALKRRGIVKEAFYELVEQVGISNHPVNLSFDMIAAINRKILDKKANRYSFLQEPVRLEIENPGIKQVEVKIHPDKKLKRIVEIGNDIFISKKDYEQFKNKEIRLMHLFNVKLKDNNKAEITSLDNKALDRVNWVSNFVNARILMPSCEWLGGIAEIAVKKLKIGEIIQFERFGFVRFDRINESGVYEFWFAHR